MKYEIEVEERVTRRNSYIVEVEDEEEGELLLCSSLEDEIDDAEHPDDVIEAITNAGYEVMEVHYGVEDVEFELM